MDIIKADSKKYFQHLEQNFNQSDVWDFEGGDFTNFEEFGSFRR
jgi:hypothetical protein